MRILSTLQIREARTLGAERAAALLAKVPDVEHTAPVVAAREAVAGYTSEIELAREGLADSRLALAKANKSVRAALAGGKGKLQAWQGVNEAKRAKDEDEARIEGLEAGLGEAVAALRQARIEATQAALEATVALRLPIEQELLQARVAAMTAEVVAIRVESHLRLLASRADHLREEEERLGKAAAAMGGS